MGPVRSALGVVVALVLPLGRAAAQVTVRLDLERELARCATVAGAAARLACYDSLAKAPPKTPSPASAPPRGSGSWEVSDDKNPLDDSRTVVLGLVATSGVSPYGKPISLMLRCKSNRTEVYITWGSYLGSDEARVTSRIGSGEARTKGWQVSTDKTGTFYPGNPVEFIKELMAADRFVAQVTPYNKSPITTVFDLAGLETAIKPLRDDCGW